MSKFKRWLEGWGIDYNQIPNTVADQFGNMKSSVNAKRGVRNDLYQSDFVTFDPTDRPEDFVKIEPLNQAKSLPQFNITGRHILPAFEGSTIFYGFRFTTPEEQFSQELKDKKKQLVSDRKELKAQLKKANATGTLKPRQKEIIDEVLLKIAEQPYFPTEGYEDHVVPIINGRLEKEGLQRVTWNRVYGYMKERKKKKKTDDSAYKIRKKLKEIESQLHEIDKSAKNKGTFLNAIEQAFLKKMKHPSTPEDRQFSEHFIKTAVDHFVRLSNGSYDYVLYPESSSEMNDTLALEIASRINAEPIKGFQKINQPTIDTHNYSKINKPNPEQQGLGGPESKQHRAIYGPSGLQKMVDTNKGQVKNITRANKPLRPYVRNWEMTPGLKGNSENKTGHSFKNKRVLIVDDNVDSGGTFQAINQIIRKHGPRKIDYYAPIVANFHS